LIAPRHLSTGSVPVRTKPSTHMWPSELDRLRESESDMAAAVELDRLRGSGDGNGSSQTVSTSSTVSVGSSTTSLDLQVSDLGGRRRWMRVPATATVGDLRRALCPRGSPRSLMICVFGEMIERDDRRLTDLGLWSGSALHAFESASPGSTIAAQSNYAVESRPTCACPTCCQERSLCHAPGRLQSDRSLTHRVDALEMRLSQANAFISNLQADFEREVYLRRHQHQRRQTEEQGWGCEGDVHHLGHFSSIGSPLGSPGRGLASPGGCQQWHECGCSCHSTELSG